MRRRLLIVEPDASGRAMMDRALGAEGYAADTAASAHDAAALLDAGVIELAIVDQLAGGHVSLDEVRWLRRSYPTVPVIVTGALLSPRVMQELLRLHVADALAKPFTPVELREAVGRAIELTPARHADALEYDAAITEARRALGAGLARRARPALARARAISAFDSDTMALCALLAEIEGDDEDAGRGYRAALALRDEEASPPPDPHEGLARLAAYEGARPVAAWRRDRGAEPFLLVSDPVAELRAAHDGGRPQTPGHEGAHVVVLALGVIAEGPGSIFLREGEGPRAFALMAGAMGTEPVALALASLGAGPILAGEATFARLDLARIEALRREVLDAR